MVNSVKQPFHTSERKISQHNCLTEMNEGNNSRQTTVPVDLYKYSSGVMCRINLSSPLTGEHSASQFSHSNDTEL